MGIVFCSRTYSWEAPKTSIINLKVYCCLSAIFCCCFHESISEINKSSLATIFLDLVKKWTEYWALFEMIAWAGYMGVARRLFSCGNLHRNKCESKRWVILSPKNCLNCCSYTLIQMASLGICIDSRVACTFGLFSLSTFSNYSLNCSADQMLVECIAQWSRC